MPVPAVMQPHEGQRLIAQVDGDHQQGAGPEVQAHLLEDGVHPRAGHVVQRKRIAPVARRGQKIPLDGDLQIERGGQGIVAPVLVVDFQYPVFPVDHQVAAVQIHEPTDLGDGGPEEIVQVDPAADLGRDPIDQVLPHPVEGDGFQELFPGERIVMAFIRYATGHGCGGLLPDSTVTQHNEPAGRCQ